jgi:hypothetical protein
MLVVGLALGSGSALAQSAIAGQVRDNTGAVLPGATVEAASPALIEGRRVVTSDGQGRYSIVDLRPGLYTVTFTLEGFTTVVRQGIDLPSNFTATVDATLGVGSLQESVTVTGASPLVDVQQTTRTQVLSREALDTLVTSRTTWSQAVLLAGVSMTGTDVGGSRAAVDLLLETHGASARHTTYNVDGMQVNTMLGEGSQQNYYQDQSNQEVAIQTSGGSAEVSAGGVFLNMIPKDGGNTFSGTLYVGGSDGSWMADNFTQELKDQGIDAINRITGIFDYGVTEGGPILKDRLWFHFSGRYWGVNQFVPDSYLDDGSQYVVEGSIAALTPRLTYQMSRNNKFRVHLDRMSKIRGPKLQAKYPAIINGLGTDPETATTWQDWRIPYGVFQTKWTSTMTNRLLVEAGYSSSFTLHPGGEPQPGVRATDYSPEWYSRVRKTDIDKDITWNGATSQQGRWPYRHVVSGAVSYVTGTHNVKVGIQQNWGSDVTHTDTNGHITLVSYRNGIPDSATVSNYPVRVDPRQKADLGIFAQDSWSLDRLTLNAGVRFEWQNSYIPEQVAPAGRFVGERHFAAVENVPNWGPDVSPRFGISYDLFGDSKTALKFSIGKYVTRQGVEFATALNPMASATVSLPWNDRDLSGRILPTNGDDVVQDNELDFRRLPTNFGERQLDRLDPDLKREYNVEIAVSAQHALTESISVAAGWYRRSFHNLILNCSSAERAQHSFEGLRCSPNVARSFNDYVPVEIVSPYNGEIITAYNLRSADILSRVDNVVMNADGNTEIYNGFDFSMEARLPGGGTVLGSTSIQRTLTNSCDQRDDPNKLRFCDRFNLPSAYNPVDFKTDFKLAGSYPIVWGMRASGTFRTTPGRTFADFGRVDELLPINWNITRTTRYTAEGCAGRPCTPGALVIPGLVQTSLIVPLAPAGTERKLPRLTQLDLGLAKTFQARGVEFTGQVQLFNALNASTVVTERSSNFGTATYGLPNEILLGRVPRLSLQMKW